MRPVVTSSESVGNSVLYSSVTLQGHEYRVGDCAYFDPDSFTFNVKHPPAANKSKHEQNDTKLVLNVFLLSFFVLDFMSHVLLHLAHMILYMLQIFSC